MGVTAYEDERTRPDEAGAMALLDDALGRLGHSIATLAERVEPILNQHDRDDAAKVAVDPRQPPTHLHERIERLQHLTSDLEALQGRIEL